jgi:hypothetical protein
MSLFKNIVETQTTCEHTLSFVVEGKAEVQKRPKIAFRAFRNKKIPFIYYDPSSKAKKGWKNKFINGLTDNDINIPVFGSDPLLFKGVHLCIEFYFSRPKWIIG